MRHFAIGVCLYNPTYVLYSILYIIVHDRPHFYKVIKGVCLFRTSIASSDSDMVHSEQLIDVYTQKVRISLSNQITFSCVYANLHEI